MLMDFVDFELHQPYLGQIVEIWTKKPAIYQGLNEYGYHEWSFFNYDEKPIYWRMADEPTVRLVQRRLQGRNDRGAN